MLGLFFERLRLENFVSLEVLVLLVKKEVSRIFFLKYKIF